MENLKKNYNIKITKQLHLKISRWNVRTLLQNGKLVYVKHDMAHLEINKTSFCRLLL